MQWYKQIVTSGGHVCVAGVMTVYHVYSLCGDGFCVTR